MISILVEPVTAAVDTEIVPVVASTENTDDREVDPLFTPV